MESVSSGSSAIFMINAIKNPEKYIIDSDNCITGRIMCSGIADGHTLLAEPFIFSLDLKPAITKINNIELIPDNTGMFYHLEFDVEYYGADQISLKEESSGDSGVLYEVFNEKPTVHIKTAGYFKRDFSWSEISAANNYGKCYRTIEYNPEDGSLKILNTPSPGYKIPEEENSGLKYELANINYNYEMVDGWKPVGTLSFDITASGVEAIGIVASRNGMTEPKLIRPTYVQAYWVPENGESIHVEFERIEWGTYLYMYREGGGPEIILVFSTDYISDEDKAILAAHDPYFQYTGVDNLKCDSELSVFKERNSLKIKSLSGTIHSVNLYDLSGRGIFKNSKEQQEYDIDTSNLKPGIYILETRTANFQKHIKKILL